MEKQKIALQRIKILFEQAKTRPRYADRYVQLARKIAMKARISIPRQYKRKFCRHCSSYFQKGNYRVRTIKHKLVYTCFKCKRFARIPLHKKKKMQKTNKL